MKVLDFGLAKALDGAARATPYASPGGRDDASAVGRGFSRAETDAATMTSPAMTAMGMILGTAAYMSPEQARGRAVDRRADIWAFGVVLYEMLTGRRAFAGDDISITLANVLKEDVPLGTLPADVPPAVRGLLRRCLEKDPKQRLRDIGEARLILADPATLRFDPIASSVAPAVVPPVALWMRALPWAAAAALGVVALWQWSPWRVAPTPEPRSLLAKVGADVSLATGFGTSAILSPDGRALAFVGRTADSGTRLYFRTLDQLAAEPLAGTEDAVAPFFSPGGESIGFFADGKLKTVPVSGGSPLTICDAPSGRGGTWTDDNTIVFTPAASRPIKLLRVATSAGSTPVEFTEFDEDGATQRWPQALPDGRTVLYTENNAGNQFDLAKIVVAPLNGGPPKVVVRGGYFGRYVPSGHLIYIQRGTLFAAPFSLDRLEVTGPAVQALEGLSATSEFGSAHLAFSADGTAVYIPGAASGGLTPIHWMTRDGKASLLRAARDRWSDPSFSPNGKRLAIVMTDGKQRDIFVYDWVTDTMTQLTFDPATDRYPVWTSDSKRIAFASDRAQPGVQNLYMMNADGGGTTTRLTESPNQQSPGSWHKSGRYLAFAEARGTATQQDVMMLPLEGDEARGWTPGAASAFVSTLAVEMQPGFSPDGNWVAFSSNAGGFPEIYVRSFSGPGEWKVRTDGRGDWPTWSATSPSLLFASEGRVMVAPYAISGGVFRADKAQLWSPARYWMLAGASVPFALHPDDARLAMLVDDGATAGDEVVFMSTSSST